MFIQGGHGWLPQSHGHNANIIGIHDPVKAIISNLLLDDDLSLDFATIPARRRQQTTMSWRPNLAGQVQRKYHSPCHLR
jgi:hypothetical protein